MYSVEQALVPHRVRISPTIHYMIFTQLAISAYLLREHHLTAKYIVGFVKSVLKYKLYECEIVGIIGIQKTPGCKRACHEWLSYLL